MRCHLAVLSGYSLTGFCVACDTDQYRIAPLPANFSDLKESHFKPLDFVKDQQAVVFPNGSTMKLRPDQTTFVTEGTLPEGGTWAMMPMPPTLLGPCCIPGPDDNATTPHKCIKGESCRGTPKGPCSPCPQTPGTDCSRCDQVSKVEPGRYTRAGVPPFPAPCDGCEGVDWNGFAVKDVVKIPESLAPGKYILGCVPGYRALRCCLRAVSESHCCGTAGSATTARPPLKSGPTALM